MLPHIEEIASKRRALGMTQKALAATAGVSQSFVAKLESGKINPSYGNVKKLYDILASFETKKNEELNVKKFYHKRVISIRPDGTMAEAASLMRRHGVSQLPVMRKSAVVGSITEGAISSLLTRKKPAELSKARVEDAMAEPFPVVGEATPLRAISSLLQYNPAVLVAKEGAVAGIVTKSDLIKLIG